MGTALQHNPAAQFAGIQATSATGQASHPVQRFTPGNALTYDAKTLSTGGTKFAAVQNEAQAKAEFGEPPSRSAWDSNYLVVTEYLEVHANGPDSIKVESCTDVYRTKDGWLIGCDYRGKNAYGGLIKTYNWFLVKKNRVTEMLPASAYSR